MSINRKAVVALEKKKAAKTNSKKANRQAVQYIRKQLENIKDSKNSSLKCSRKEKGKLSPTGNSDSKTCCCCCFWLVPSGTNCN